MDYASTLAAAGITTDAVGKAVGVVAGSIIAAKIVYVLLARYVSKVTAKTKTKLDDRLLSAVHRPLYKLMVLGGVYIAFTQVLVTPASGLVTALVSILAIFVATFFAANLVNILVDQLGKKIVSATESSADDEALPFVNRIINITIYFLGFSLIVNQLGYSITPLIASFGIAGFAIGFAAKDTLSNIIAGFFLLVDRNFRIGDRVKIGSYIGDVDDIGLRNTKIKTLDHNLVIIPNNKIVTTELTNYQQPDVKIKLILPFGVVYGTDVSKAKEIILDVARNTDLVLDDPEPKVFFTEFGSSSLDLKLVLYIKDLRKKWTVKDAVNTRINELFNDAGIEIAFPTQTVYVKRE